MKFEPTNVERLILANQYDILAKLDPSEAAAHRTLAHNLRHGYSYLYHLDTLDLRPELSEGDMRLALDALSLFSSLQDSTKDVDDPDGSLAKAVKWPGFDGNNEIELLGFTNALRENDQYAFLMPNGAVNSGIQTSHMYIRMLSAWKSIGKPHSMTPEQVATVIAARRHPDA